MSDDLKRLFEPESVCIIGASADPSTISGRPLRILRQHDFPGTIYPVNPKYTEIDGVPCFPSVEAIPLVPDVAIVVVAAAHVPAILDECGRKGIANAIVISSGFEEDDTAASLVARLGEVVRRHGMNVVGPNSEGIWSVPNTSIMTFGSAALRPDIIEGPISVISQSGSIGGNAARSLQERGLGCRYFISAGNETVLSTADYLDFIVAEGGSSVVLLFLEGLKDGQHFLEAVDRAHAAGVDVVALKAGASEAGSAAAASHTGKITSGADVYAHVFEQAGIVQVDTIGDLVDAAEVLVTPQLRLPVEDASGPASGRGIALVAPGATRTVMADTAERLGVPLATFSAATEAALGELVPSYGYAKNPVDVTAQVSTAGMFGDVLEIMGNDPATEALVIQWGNRGVHHLDEVRETGREVQRAIGKPVLIGLLGERWELQGDDRSAFRDVGVACAMTPDDVLQQVSWLYRTRDFARRRHAGLSGDTSPAIVPRHDGRTNWAGFAPWLAECGFTVPPWVSLDAAAGEGEWSRALDEVTLRYPVVVKADPDAVAHKTERGLVTLGVEDAGHVIATLTGLVGSAPDVPAFLVQEMVPAGVEALVTVRLDRDFGAVLTIGVGGGLVELIDDVRHVALPGGRDEVEEAIDRTRLSQLLAGVPGSPPADREALVRAVLALAGSFAEDPGGIAEIELNPVIVGAAGNGAAVVDVIIQREVTGRS